jgi:hypothetical protein
MDRLNKLIQDIEQELNKNSNDDSQTVDGFEPTTYKSHSGDSDEIFLSANNDEQSSSAELSQNFHEGDSDGILLSTEINENNATTMTIELSETEDSNEIILSETDQNKGEISSLPEEIICTTCHNPGINQVDPNLHREESDNIIWSTMIRLLNTPNEKAKTYLNEGNETFHSFKEYIGTLHQYSGANLTSNYNSEDEKSSYETVIESLKDTANSVLVVKDEKDLSQNSDENEILPESR